MAAFFLSLEDLYSARKARERLSEAAAVGALRQQSDRRADDRSRFDLRSLTDADRQELVSKIKAAFEAGQREVMIVSCPADYCSDGGRRINNRLPGWQDTLPAGAQAFLAFWQDALQPGGFGLAARILSFPSGMPGDVGLFVTWPQGRS